MKDIQRKMCHTFTLLAIVAMAVSTGQQQYSDTMPLSNDVRIQGLINEPKDCPTSMYFANVSGDCICGITDFHAVKCDQSTGKVYVLGTYQMTYDEEYQKVVLGASLYGYCYPSDQFHFDIYHEVPMNLSQLNEAVCGSYNRKGRLCGECKESYSPLVYSYKISCEKCSGKESKKNILMFMVIVLIPLTSFYLVVVIFKFNANSPKVHGFILYAQLMSAPFVVRVLLANNAYNMITGVKVIVTLYGIWNLDFFRTLYPDMCVSLTTLQVISLDYIIAIYPLLLMALTLLLFKLHFHDCKIIYGVSGIHFTNAYQSLRRTGVNRYP